MRTILQGKLVSLSAVGPEELGKAFSNWSRDTEYARLLGSGAWPQRSSKAIRESMEKDLEKQDAAVFSFSIRSRDDDRLIGEITLDVVGWSASDAFVGLGIGERELWGRGCGTEAMNLLLDFAFREVNLRRVTLTVFEYNPRAIRSYEKAGFHHEGRLRQFLSREGRRWDMLCMGILREEWIERQQN